MPLKSAEELMLLSKAIFVASGSSEEEATVVAEHLVDSNLTGHDSHGVQRIAQYIDEIDQGFITPSSEVKIEKDWESGSVIDGHHVYGQVSCAAAMKQALDKAQGGGVAAVTLFGANHSGRLGTYGEMAAAAGMVGIVFVNAGGAGQWVAPFGGKEKRLSTNPICIGAPSGGDFPILLDMGTAVAPEGKIRHYHKSGMTCPDGWLIDGHGNPTNDPGALYEDPPGAILPVGGSAGHKGFGLGFLIEILTGALSGAGVCRADLTGASGKGGLLFLAIDIENFTALDGFRDKVTVLADYVKTSPPAPGFQEVLVPGEFEHRNRQVRSKEGIDVPDVTWAEINGAAKKVGASV
jgi:uncharacterized oxidoreductase